MITHDIESTELTGELIDTAALDHVTGGGWAGDAWNWVKNTAGSLFSGGGGTNLSMQNGNNQRSAQGNQGPVSLGDNSPITVNGGGPR